MMDVYSLRIHSLLIDISLLNEFIPISLNDNVYSERIGPEGCDAVREFRLSLRPFHSPVVRGWFWRH